MFGSKKQQTVQEQPENRKFFRTSVIVGGVIGMIGVSLAFAQFTTNVEPWAPGKVATAQHLTATASVDGAIWPGDCNDVTLQVHNPNQHAVTVASLNNTGFRNVSDTTPSEGSKANRLEDFLYQADVSNALNGQYIPAYGDKTFTVPNAVCLRSSADDARQGDTFEAGYALAVNVEPGGEANN